MTDTKVEKALEAGYRAVFAVANRDAADKYAPPEPALAEVFKVFFAAALRALEPTPEMMSAGGTAFMHTMLREKFDPATLAIWRAMASKLAEQATGKNPVDTPP